MGGDEFAVLSEATPGTDPAVLSRRLQTNIEAYNREHAGPWRLGMSWGVTVFDPAHPVSLDELVAAADNLMYREKKAKAAAGA
jgi:diguanylate cyclase (GGDEF)-like protein